MTDLVNEIAKGIKPKTCENWTRPTKSKQNSGHSKFMFRHVFQMPKGKEKSE